MTHKTTAEKLRALADELDPPTGAVKGERWRPENDQKYWTIGWRLEAFDVTWTNHRHDKESFEAFNIFPTREAAELEARRTRARRHLRAISERVGDRDNKEWKSIPYIGELRDLCVFETRASHVGSSFCSRQAAIDAVAEIGLDNFKLLCGVG